MNTTNVDEVFTTEIIDGTYGQLAIRAKDRRYWYCFDSEFEWECVCDNYGDLIEVSDCVRWSD